MRRDSAFDEAAADEEEIGGALGQAAHEVGIPVGAVGHTEAHLQSPVEQRFLQLRADAEEHLELEALRVDAVAVGVLQRVVDDALIVGRDGGEVTVAEGALEQPQVGDVNVGFPGVGDLRRFEANDRAPDYWRLYAGLTFTLSR